MIGLVVGLGNPGGAYVRTRHNVGFMVIDQLARMLRVSVSRRQGEALTGEAAVRGRRVLLAKPQTYMNLSGNAVGALSRRLRLLPEEILVVSDDMDLPFGRLRLRPGGGAGGHRGLVSIIEALGTDRFPRLRVGIGRGEEAVGHVLGGFTPAEDAVLDRVLETAARAVLTVCADGLDRAMNLFNRWGIEAEIQQ
ncbi:MAG: aminoacyl-tRNA hydrolase [Thermoanaerobacterales bacterium]|nr:aminoacyl-tRNA hydrolase [Thermoanaerobacterales bacterium]